MEGGLMTDSRALPRLWLTSSSWSMSFGGLDEQREHPANCRAMVHRKHCKIGYVGTVPRTLDLATQQPRITHF